MIQYQELERLVGADLAQHWHGWIVTSMRRWGITNEEEQRHFVAQILHESGGLRHTLEIASGEAYEGRADLGNTEPGDGPRFKGRGLIQLTGRHNYSRYAAASGFPVVDAPRLLEQPRLAADVAGWYWHSRGIGALFDGSLAGEELLRAVTRKINGGLNGLTDRRRRLNRVTEVMGTVTSTTPPVTEGVSSTVDWLVLNPPHSLEVAEEMGRASVTGAPVVVRGPVTYRVRPASRGGTKLDVRVGETIVNGVKVQPSNGKAAVASSGMIGTLVSAGSAFALAFLPAFGVEVTPTMEDALVQLIAAFSLLGVYGRVKADKPITGVFRAKNGGQ